MAAKRFKGIQGVRAYVGRVLKDLEALGDKADPRVAQAKFSGARLLSELITRHALEDRIQALEKSQRTGVVTRADGAEVQ